MGLRVRLPLSLMDLSFSYFRGFDRMFTPVIGYLTDTILPFPYLEALEYHRSQVLGGDLFTFLGDWAVRIEGA